MATYTNTAFKHEEERSLSGKRGPNVYQLQEVIIKNGPRFPTDSRNENGNELYMHDQIHRVIQRQHTSSDTKVHQENGTGHMSRGSSRGGDRRKETVVVIGTGDLGRALTMCLLRAGYRVIVASRNPEKHRARMEAIGGEVETIELAAYQSQMILVAIPFEGFESLPQQHLMEKILVDVSNRPLNYDSTQESLAVRLQKLLPESRVVKAFNTLSAYALQQGVNQGSKEVPICSNDDEAKSKTMNLARNIGFSPVDYGGLANSKVIEDIPLAFFPEWRTPLVFAFVVWILCFLLVVFRFHLCPNFERLNNGQDWDSSNFYTIPYESLHYSFGMTAFTCLASCYAPGVLAAYFQLYRQTKYSEFPKWLDNWLKSRKQIGLIALLFVIPHFILAIITFLGYGGLWPRWTESFFFMFGVLALVLMIILGITSLPSVASSLTWREFSFVQRYLGWWCLFLATWHVICISWKKLYTNQFECIFLPDISQVVSVLPFLTILFKLPLLLPFVDHKLQKIRRGYEGPKARK